MRGYLLKKESITIGEARFVESEAEEFNYVVAFEDDTETGYFYAAEKDEKGGLRILDMLFIYDAGDVSPAQRKVELSLIWSTDWQRCALVLGNTCHAIFDFKNKAGYNIASFPPPVLWTGEDRKLTQEMVRRFFV